MAASDDPKSEAQESASESLARDGLRFRALAESPFDRILEIDSTGAIRYSSPNHDRPEADGLQIPQILESVHPEDRDELLEAMKRVFLECESFRMTFRVLTEEDDPRFIECTATALPDGSEGTRALLVSRDVTSARSAQERIVQGRERFRLIAENAYDLIAEFDSAGRALYVNDPVLQTLGERAAGDWMERPENLIHPDDREPVRKVFLGALRGERTKTITYRAFRNESSYRWLEARFRAAKTSTGELRVVLIARDRSEKVEAERRLVESETRYREIVENSPLGILVIQDAQVSYANRIGGELCGALAPEALVGTAVDDLIENENPETRARIRQAQNRKLAGPALFDLQISGLDGHSRDVVATVNEIQFEGRLAHQALLTDTTGRRIAEREQARLELQLQEARKLESLGMLAGGIAHDFNNLLAVILANARFALRHGSADAELTEALEESVEAGERAARLTRQLLAYAGRRAPDVRSARLADLVQATSEVLRTAIPKHVTLTIDCDESSPPVHADIVQVEQVLMNLVINAADAIGEAEGTVRVTTGTDHIRPSDPRRLVEGGDLSPGQYAYFEVLDSGQGMSQETQDRVFEPFFTTKATGHGLGLATVIGLVRGHGGAVELSSTLGEGTRFRVFLPAMPDPKPPPIVNLEERDVVLFFGDGAALRRYDAWRRHECPFREYSRVEDVRGEIHSLRKSLKLIVCVDDDTGHASEFVELVRNEAPEVPIVRAALLSDSDRWQAAREGAIVLRPPVSERQFATALETLLGKS